ncbi:sulfite exporter TauE/SafE family protein [Paenibacillus sp. IB182496]|uniref:Sulfite exporter TauE/SafE family protein n=1 Tax=Paenibacillus sabuli TaxID=2772509 RepID=A0A927BXF7_9BACL|nr:sulfite exporter TauE/SafE family protein [Paenibacillus sabuli]MBD2847390.1 sulfite exporter TauE/SafE family protein [Paenibacillus sabuli]
MSLTMQSLGLVAAAGLMGAPHCAAMCGGFVSAIALRSPHRPLLGVLAYNAGRVMTYAAIGAVMGAIGSFLDIAGGFVGLQGAASILGGLLILLWTLRRYTLPTHRVLQRADFHARLTRLGQSSGQGDRLSAFVTGLLLGLLPCGLTYAMQINAAASGSGWAGMLIMLVFGLATFPVLLLTALAAGSLAQRWRRSMRRAGTMLACLMGVLALLKGCAANGWIPSVHPWLW